MPDFVLEDAAGDVVVGVDEAGRGPLAGPVVAAAVVLPRVTLPDILRHGLDDSKQLTRARRAALDEVLRGCAHVGIGIASVAEIDVLNILQASLVAMARAVADLRVVPEIALVDGNQPPALACPVRCIVGGDGRSLSIAAASIVAKVRRDAIMHELAKDFPGFGWERNAGYGTAEHLEALARLGPTPQHRRSFRPVAKYLERPGFNHDMLCRKPK
jgi:ribonuclease HII